MYMYSVYVYLFMYDDDDGSWFFGECGTTISRASSSSIEAEEGGGAILLPFNQICDDDGLTEWDWMNDSWWRGGHIIDGDGDGGDLLY